MKCLTVAIWTCSSCIAPREVRLSIIAADAEEYAQIIKAILVHCSFCGRAKPLIETDSLWGLSGSFNIADEDEVTNK
jgi:hypothetical protein